MRMGGAANGIFTVSLDFELYWGMSDICELDDGYQATLRRTRHDVIPRLLALFEDYGVHATWATVGFLLFESGDDLRAAGPARLPTYDDANLSNHDRLADVGADEADDPYRLAPSLVEAIRAVPGQELGSHSFSHYYCLEPGPADDAFLADLTAWRNAADERGIDSGSICFGRNQYGPRDLDHCTEAGFDAYRGNEPFWCYTPRAGADDGLPRKLARRADTYAPLFPHHCPTLDDVAATAPRNVASSRFLRMVDRRLRFLEPLKRRRVATGMAHAARTGGIYHLWWHPQDLAVDTDDNFALVTSALDAFARCRDEYGMASLNMGEIAERADRAAEAPA
ncbi:MAG: polysaccharide deacetylase [Actinomycetota bacterium]